MPAACPGVVSAAKHPTGHAGMCMPCLQKACLVLPCSGCSHPPGARMAYPWAADAKNWMQKLDEIIRNLKQCKKFTNVNTIIFAFLDVLVMY